MNIFKEKIATTILNNSIVAIINPDNVLFTSRHWIGPATEITEV